MQRRASRDSEVTKEIRPHSARDSPGADIDLEKDVKSGINEYAADDISIGDSNTVWWDGDNDPENPKNWSASRKWRNLGVMAAITFLSSVLLSLPCIQN